MSSKYKLITLEFMWKVVGICIKDIDVYVGCFDVYCVNLLDFLYLIIILQNEHALYVSSAAPMES